MAASISISAAPSGGQKANQSVTITLAGHTGTTAYVVSVSTPGGHTWAQPVTTTGGGGATVVYVPQAPGTHTVTSALAVPAAAATITFNSGGCA